MYKTSILLTSLTIQQGYKTETYLQKEILNPNHLKKEAPYYGAKNTAHMQQKNKKNNIPFIFKFLALY